MARARLITETKSVHPAVGEPPVVRGIWDMGAEHRQAVIELDDLIRLLESRFDIAVCDVGELRITLAV